MKYAYAIILVIGLLTGCYNEESPDLLTDAFYKWDAAINARESNLSQYQASFHLLAVAKSQNNLYYQAVAYEALGGLYIQMDTLHKISYCYQMAIDGYSSTGHYERAAGAAVKLCKTYGRYGLYGLGYAVLRDLQSAEWYEHAGEHHDFVEYHMGYLLFMDGDLAGARLVWENLSTQDAAYLSAAHNWLGVVHMEYNELTEAEAEFERAIDYTDENRARQMGIYYHNLAEVAQKRGDVAMAIDHYEVSLSYKAAPEDAPYSIDTRTQLARLLAQEGKEAAAIELLQQNFGVAAGGFSNDLHESCTLLAKLYFAQGNAEAAYMAITERDSIMSVVDIGAISKSANKRLQEVMAGSVNEASLNNDQEFRQDFLMLTAILGVLCVAVLMFQYRWPW